MNRTVVLGIAGLFAVLGLAVVNSNSEVKAGLFRCAGKCFGCAGASCAGVSCAGDSCSGVADCGGSDCGGCFGRLRDRCHGGLFARLRANRCHGNRCHGLRLCRGRRCAGANDCCGAPAPTCCGEPAPAPCCEPAPCCQPVSCCGEAAPAEGDHHEGGEEDAAPAASKAKNTGTSVAFRGVQFRK